MSGDEVLALVVSGFLALFLWGRWYWHATVVRAIGGTAPSRAPLMVAPLLAAVLLFIVLRRFASHDVRAAGTYLTFYIVLGAGWVGVGAVSLAWLGVSPRLDALERRNAAAAVAVAGAVVGLTLAFAGGNVGDGPGWWVVVL